MTDYVVCMALAGIAIVFSYPVLRLIFNDYGWKTSHHRGAWKYQVHKNGARRAVKWTDGEGAPLDRDWLNGVNYDR